MSRIAVLLLILSVAVACQQQECKKPTKGRPINANGDSELALLMRDMFTESDSLKLLVENGQQLSGLRRYEEIHSAIPTDSTVRGPVFDAFAQNYMASLKQLEQADSSTIFNFNHMVDQCMNCHTEFCPGPKRRIKKLYIR
jgi:nitrous oxidase accessory protein NosD